jgi:hypothetical protein
VLTDLNDLTARFRRDGYAVVEGAFSPGEVARMRDEADRILERVLNSSLANGRRSGRLDMRQVPGGPQVVRKIQPINDMSLYLAEVSGDERLVGPLRALMGEEPVLMEEKLNYKEPLPDPVRGLDIPEKDDRFPIHSDWAYYKAQSYPQTIISSAISFDDCTKDSGPLHVWPGSHAKDLPHERMDNGLQVVPGHLDPDGGVDILAPAGSVMFFHALLVHNSKPNGSGRPRRLMIYSHYPKSANMGFDVRNGPGRLRESPWEWEYQRKKDRGEYVDRFRAPVF